MAGYSLTIGLNALDHLGVNLYSSVPAVLSEAVANAWDADARSVAIDANPEEITIRDDGHGMTKGDCNEKFLTVGYERRKERGESPGGRAVMGRKGIGKLSLFSIADVVEIHTAKYGQDKAGFIMDMKKIRASIKEGGSPTTTCELEEVGESNIEIERGTVIKLTSLKKRVGNDAKAVRKNLARRFSVIDPSNFTVAVNGEAITAEDRDYVKKLEYVWCMGSGCDAVDGSSALKTEIGGTVDALKGYEVRGWVGTVRKQKDIDDVNNRITVMARGKIIHEDILGDIKEGGIFSKYIIGEIQADFLDMDGELDIATSNRQSVMEDSGRFVSLRKYVRDSVIKRIHSEWTELRTKGAKDDALRDPAVKEWFDSLTPDRRKYAERLFGKIETFRELDEEAKIELYRASILAFETLSTYDQLSELDEMHGKDLDALIRLFGDVDKLEAAHYLNITRCRMKVLEKFQNLADENAKERVMQEYLFDHLWLLDPSWERAGEDKRMEESFKKACGETDAGLAKSEERSRIDIRYRTHAGMHVIVELKRHGAVENIHDLSKQIDKYNIAMEKVLKARQEDNPQISIVCVLGRDPAPAGDPKKMQEQLKLHNGRYVTYESLIRGATNAYKEYFDEWKGVKNVKDLVESIRFRQPEHESA